jgi:periplasmic divalent cation tolerance protein
MEDCKDSDIWTATTTLGSRADAERLARELLSRRLAACVQLDAGVRSFYVWEGKACEDDEVRVTIKTTAGSLEALQSALKELHPYELPQFTAWPVGTSEAYGDWVRQAAP